MKNVFQLIIAPTFLTFLLISDLYANQECSSKHLLICTKLPSGNIMEKCVPNANMENFFVNNPESIIGSCDTFDSSKLKIFACNAGLRFAPSAEQRCIKRDQNNSISSSCGDSLDCTCSTNEDTGNNYFSFGIADNSDVAPSTFIKKTLTSSNAFSYASASPQSGQHVLQDGSNLLFNLGSDFYGAEYYVDLCVQNLNPNALEQNLNLNGEILMTNSLFSSLSYNMASGLSNKVDVICLNSNGTTSTSTIAESTYFNMSQRKYLATINGSPLCIVRHYFKETALNKFRENSYKKVTFQTNIQLTPNNSDSVQSGPVNFCNIIKRQNNYTCTQWSSENQQAFIEALKINGSFFSGNTYTGPCPKICAPL